MTNQKPSSPTDQDAGCPKSNERTLTETVGNGKPETAVTSVICEGNRAAAGGASPVRVSTVTPPAEATTGAKTHKELILLPGDYRQLSEFAKEIGTTVAKQNIYQRSGLVFEVDAETKSLVQMSAQRLRSWVEQHCTCIRRKSGDEGPRNIRRTMTTSDAQGVLAAPQFHEQLRRIERLNPIRMPVIRDNGSLELLPEGYDERTRTYTFLDAQVHLNRIPREQAIRTINEFLGEFVFADKTRSKAVAIGGMMTVFARSILPAKSLRPCFVFVANAEGAGKTLLVKLCTVPVLGFAPTACKPRDEDEMRKQLLTTVMEGRLVLAFDNVKGHISSEALEGFVTAQAWEDRILGQSRNFRGENNVVVFVTGNGCTLSPDMRRRSLVAELFLEGERAEERQFKQELEVPALLARRSEILSALWSLICDWHEAGRPDGSLTNASFPEWSRIIGGILEHAGFGNPVERPTTVQDTDSNDMRRLVETLAEESAAAEGFTFEMLVHTARKEGLFPSVICDGEELNRRDKAKFASLLKGYDRRIVANWRFLVLGEGRSRRFRVEPVDQS